jgi:cob(I)alamin adenosyltransferase
VGVTAVKEESYDNAKDRFDRGYVQIYTGNGKGKTTASIGLVLRALGAGLRVLFAQLIKGSKYSEIKMLERISEFGGSVTFRQYGEGRFIVGKPSDSDKAAAKLGLEEIRTAMTSGEYDLVVLDEANVAAKLGLISYDDLISLIDDKPDMVELVLTGRGASEELMERADLVTEMREIKHYYQKGVMARRGIES